MRAARMLAENIQTLLRERHLSQHDLAEWCRHSDVWLSKFLAGQREVQLKDLDRIADFFGKATYEMFIPGGTLERRSGHDRRANHERRVGHAQRLMVGLAQEIAPYRSGKGRLHVAAASPLIEELRRLTEEHERKVSALVARAESGGQAAATRRAQSRLPARDRTVRGSDPETP